VSKNFQLLSRTSSYFYLKVVISDKTIVTEMKVIQNSNTGVLKRPRKVLSMV
jgi:hypothetical protein